MRRRPPFQLTLDRRTALKGLGALAASPLVGACGDDPIPGTISEAIDTVVVVMMENRSFDHYFGAYSLEEGRNDIDGLTADMSNLNAAGQPITPHAEAAGCIADPPHGWNASHRQWNEGRNDGFVTEHEAREGEAEGPRVMGYLTRQDLPVFYALADEFTLCQRWFASVMGPTWPNRFYLYAAQNGGVTSNDFGADYSFFNIFDRLKIAGIPFHDFYGNLSFSFLFPREADYGEYKKTLPEFFEHAAAGTLPPVSIVEPIYGRNDDHPPAHPKAGQLFVSSIYDALAKSPQWQRCLVIVTYDEHGGFYDHVAPPKIDDVHADKGFDQLGFRVPALVMGPYVKRKHVSSVVFNHASIVAFITRLFGLPSLTLRDAASGDLTQVLDMDLIAERRPAPPLPSLPVIEASDEEIYAPACVLGGGLGFSLSGASIGQVELEQFAELHVRAPGVNRRAQTDQIYEEFLRHVERRGLLRRRA